ncbi:MAG TPA: universal stress protein [Dissulfurispiraceae bacterium]|nr:universal stress protein [Dissulfurispiraceae bacterium]
MKKILIAVDDTRTSKAVLSTFYNMVKPPEEALLLHVQKLEGRSSMIDMLGNAEMSTLKESLKGTEYKEELDRKAENILNYYKNELADGSRTSIRTMKREGHPADEILKVAEEEAPELIILGYSRKKGLAGLLSGSVAREVGKNAKVPVLIAKGVTMCEEPYTWRDAYYAMSVFATTFLLLLILGKVL